MAGGVAIENKRFDGQSPGFLRFTTTAILWFPLREFAHGGNGEGPSPGAMKIDSG
jgi:hypothetical protein